MKNQTNIWYRFQKILFCFFLTTNCFAQSYPLDQLKVRLAQHPANDTVRANIIVKITETYKPVNKDSMFHYCALLLDEARQSENPLQLAQANKMIGLCWQDIQPSESLDYFRQAFEIYKNEGNKTETININNMIAISYYNMDDCENQLLYLKKALQDVLESDNKELEISILHHISETYFHLKNYALAEEYSSMALTESHRCNDWMRDQIMIVQARIEFQKGNYLRSIGICENVLSHVRQEDRKEIEITCMTNIAECRIKLKQYKEAQRLLERCNQIIDPEDNLADHCRNLRLMITLDSAMGNFAQAFETQRKLEKLVEKKYSPEQVWKVSDMTMQAEARRLDHQLTQLESAYNEHEKQMAQTNTLIVIFIVIAGGGIILLIWTRYSSKKLRREKEQIQPLRDSVAEKKEKLSGNFETLIQNSNELKKTYNKLIHTDRSKTELFRVISHDLQTPLVKLQQNLTELMGADISEQQFRQATAGLTETVSDMSLLLENLLQWSKVQSQCVNVKPQYIEIVSLVNETIDLHKHSAAEKKCTLVNAMEHRLYVYADEDMIKCLMKNMLQNIIRLSGANASATIYGDKNQKDGWIRINHQGNMPLKEKFFQLSEAENYSSDQSEIEKAISLGWILCRTLVYNNNGSIRIEKLSPESFDIFISLPLDGSTDRNAE